MVEMTTKQTGSQTEGVQLVKAQVGPILVSSAGTQGALAAHRKILSSFYPLFHLPPTKSRPIV